MADNYMFASIADIQQLLKGTQVSPSLAMLNNVMAGTIGMSMHNAVTTQHNAQMLSTASTTSTCARILSITAPIIPQLPAPVTPIPPTQASPPATPPSSAQTPTPFTQLPPRSANDANNDNN